MIREIILYLEKLVTSATDAINQASSIASLDSIRIKYLGKKGYLTLQTINLRALSEEERPTVGATINEAKEKIKQALNTRRSVLENKFINICLAKEKIDISLPGRRIENGGSHPVTCTINRIESFFSKLGFIVVTGPEIEDNYHNFEALNIPIHHPVRTDHETFWFDTRRLLRTQMSSVQIRTMKEKTPPIRIIAPGRVYRNDYDQTHTPMFHQMEGLIIDKRITLANLKRTLNDFLQNFFEKDLKIRFRPSYFPFTEPSAEIDVMNKNGKWLEVLGCGMVHPNVLRNMNTDPEIYSGFAFGMGIERLTMLRYDVNDLREFFRNDLRFLKQFK